MDLEHLNKTQIILLTLLVSFVTSIATGIVTVSLVNQAPPQMQAAVNHIIERTVQQVMPATQTASPATTIKTVVVKNDDLAAQSIASVRKSIIRIVSADAPDIMVARGIIIDAKGVAITDRGVLDAAASYLAILPDGTHVPAAVRSSGTTTPVALLDLTLATSTPALTPATFADPSKLQLGQSVIRIGGTGGDSVGEGVIAMLPASDKSASRMVEASVSSATPGSVLISLFGEVIGIITTDSQLVGGDFYSMPSIFKAAAQSADATSAATAAGSAPSQSGTSAPAPAR